MARTTKRDAILVAALDELSRRGFHGARIERVAASANANKQLIFHYFGSKDGLYAAAVSHTLSTAPRTAPGGQPPEALREYAAALREWLAASPWSAVMIAECLSGIDVPEEAVTAARTWIWETSAVIRSMIDDGQRKGHFRDDIDYRTVMELIIGTAVGQHLVSGRPAAESSVPAHGGSALGQVLSDFCAWR